MFYLAEVFKLRFGMEECGKGDNSPGNVEVMLGGVTGGPNALPGHDAFAFKYPAYCRR